MAVLPTHGECLSVRRDDLLRSGPATSKMYDTEGVPSANYVTLAVTGAGSAGGGTVFMFYDRHRL